MCVKIIVESLKNKYELQQKNPLIQNYCIIVHHVFICLFDVSVSGIDTWSDGFVLQGQRKI